MAAAAAPPKDKIQNWVKGAIALYFTKEGLEEFVLSDISNFQTDILKSIGKNIGTTSRVACNSCTTANILPCPTNGFCTKGGKCKVHSLKNPKLKPNVQCPTNSCHAIRGYIRREHRYYAPGKSEPSWRNADATQFCTDPFQLAKCYMSADGYSEVKSMKETDFNGVINIMLNNKRFQNKMAAKLLQPKNICTEARDIGRLIRHSANLSVSDADITKYIDTLIDLLSDPKCLAVDKNAQAAVAKLQMLKANSVSLEEKQMQQIIKDAFEESFDTKKKLVKDDIAEHMELAKEGIAKHADKEKSEMLKMLQETAKDLKNQLLSTSKDVVKEISKGGSKVIQEIDEKQKLALRENNSTNVAKANLFEDEQSKKNHRSILIQIPEQVDAEIIVSPKANNVSETDFDMLRLTKGLREDLILHYRDNYSTAQVSPLVEEHDESLLNIYVPHQLVSVDVVKIFNRFQEPPNERPIKSCKEMLFHGSEPYKNIYITAREGVGKTAFVKYLSMMWCHAKEPDTNLVTTFKKEDVEAIDKFDFLFLIFLKETNDSGSHVDDMIESQVLKRLSRQPQYSKNILTNILHDKMCLIILDGLDEWYHPCGSGCTLTPIPHRSSRQKCTTITTTRPWKLIALQLGVNQIDKHLKICEFEECKVNLLIENAVSILNKRSKQHKSADDLKTLLAKTKHDKLLVTPYILLHFICLWFDGESMGNSKCELFTKVVDLTLIHGIHKIGNFSVRTKNAKPKKQFPTCFRHTEECRTKYDLLLGIGRLAFETLFSENTEHCLVFEKSTVTKYMSENLLEKCVSIGILTLNKIFGKVSIRGRNYSFQHKSMQEYFAALYIQSEPSNVEIKHTITSKCNTLPAVLEISPIFVFVSGFNQSIATAVLSETLAELSKDDIAQKYRSESSLVRSCFVNARAIKSIQNVVVECASESIDNGHENIKFCIEDIAIDTISKQTEYLHVLNTLLEIERNKLVSFSLNECRSADEANGILQTLNLKKICNLRKLELSCIPASQVLQPLLKGSTSCLECLDLCSLEFDQNTNKHYHKIVKLSSEHVRIILNMEHLEVLTLCSLRIDHTDMDRLLTSLSSKTFMRHIVLNHVECSSHKNTCSGFMLNLSRFKFLQVMGLDNIPLSSLCFNPVSIEEFWVGRLAPEYLLKVFECLEKSEKLHTLYCLKLDNLEAMMKSIPNLDHLRYISFQQIDFGNRVIRLTSKSRNLEIVSLNGSNMSSTALRLLVDGIANFAHEVDICLEDCKVTPVEDYRKIKGLIRSSPNFTVTFEGFNKCKKHVFNFGTVKTLTISSERSLKKQTFILQSTRL